MDVRTYRAATIQDALQMVRRELGPGAAVLHTRAFKTGGILSWLIGRRGIEVVASNQVYVPSRLAPRASDDTGAAIESYAPAATVRNETLARPALRDQASDPQHEIKSQISELQAMIERLCKGAGAATQSESHPSLFRVYTDLIEAEISEPLAKALIERLREQAAPRELADPALLQARLCALLEGDVQASGPIKVDGAARRVAALVGPTGVGKTTTIAKLAANFRLREKKAVALITVDTYRVAAVEQLRTYADIIDLPMEVVSTPREMRAAVERFANYDLVLIDTAGRSPSDDVRIHELRTLLAEAGADEVHLVLSSVASAASLRRVAERFAPAGPTSIIFTKLDEATAAGSLLEVLEQSRLPVSYVTDGQNVPDDIRPADGKRLVRQIVGLEPLTGR